MKTPNVKSIVLIILATSITVFLLFNVTQKRTQVKMGTFVEITLRGPAWTDFNKIFNKAFSEIDRVEKMVSTFDAKSPVSVINRKASHRPVKISPELFDLIEEAVLINKNTQGAFDITIAPLVQLWGFYKGKDTFPPEEKIKEALEMIGSGSMALNKSDKTVFFKKKLMQIDLAAIAKGYSVDKACEVIKMSGIKNAIVNAGGDLYCLGRRNVFKKWSIGIQDPAQKGEITKTIYLENKAAATSGGYEKFFTHNTKTYSHLIDPRTGMPKEEFCNATVIADSCTLADALATAACIAGKEKTGDIKRKYNNVEIIISERS